MSREVRATPHFNSPMTPPRWLRVVVASASPAEILARKARPCVSRPPGHVPVVDLGCGERFLIDEEPRASSQWPVWVADEER